MTKASHMWHVRFSANDIRRGTFEQLQALAARGKIRPSMPVRAPGQPSWVRADAVPNLFPELAEIIEIAESELDPFQSTSSAGTLGVKHQPSPRKLDRPRWIWLSAAGAAAIG